MTEGVFRTLTAGLKPGQQERLLRALTEEETRESDWDWPSWAHRGQLPPETCPDGSPWRTWVLMAGRGFGKTLAGAKWITAQIAARTLTFLESSSPSIPRRRRHLRHRRLREGRGGEGAFAGGP